MPNTGKNVQQFQNMTGTGQTNVLEFQLGMTVEGVLQWNLTAGTMTFTVQGRIDPTAPWVDLTGSLNEGSAKAQPVARMHPAVRINITAMAGGGTFTSWIMA